MVRNCPMISPAVYRFRAMPPPFAGRKLNSRSGLVYRGQVKLTVPLSMSGPCSIRISSESPTFVPNSRRRTNVQCGVGCLTRTFLRSQRLLLNCDLPSRCVPELGTRHQKTRKFPQTGQNCSESMTPESVQLPVYVVLTSNPGDSPGIYSQSRRCPVVWFLAVRRSVPCRTGK